MCYIYNKDVMILGCIVNFEFLGDVALTCLGAGVASFLAIRKFYDERKRALKEEAYKEYVAASQALAAHLTANKATKATHQKRYFQACANIYICGSERVLDIIKERHSDLAINDLNKQQEYFQLIVEAMRDDLGMDKTHNIPFHLVVIHNAAENEDSKGECLLNRLFLTCPHGHE